MPLSLRIARDIVELTAKIRRFAFCRLSGGRELPGQMADAPDGDQRDQQRRRSREPAQRCHVVGEERLHACGPW